jgi:hypothetical protein
MLSLPPTVLIYLAAQPTGLRKSFDSLTALVRERLRGDPLSGDILKLPSLPPPVLASVVSPLCRVRLPSGRSVVVNSAGATCPRCDLSHALNRRSLLTSAAFAHTIQRLSSPASCRALTPS